MYIKNITGAKREAFVQLWNFAGGVALLHTCRVDAAPSVWMVPFFWPHP